jgi:RHS repeat-associated protein
LIRLASIFLTLMIFLFSGMIGLCGHAGVGNRFNKQIGATTVQTYTYDYDYENRLTVLGDTSKGVFTYTYDHRTRRVGRNEYTGSVGFQPTSEEISFSGGTSVQEYTTDNPQPTMEYIRGSDYGGGIGGVLYTIRSGAKSYNAYNSRGDVVSKTDQSGAITYQAAYEAFGTRTKEQGTTLDRQKANTKDEDPTGLINEGFRLRDLEFGVFITPDPLGYVDGPNRYTYVRQNPWTKFDPLGLYSFKKLGGGAWTGTKNLLSSAWHMSGPGTVVDIATGAKWKEAKQKYEKVQAVAKDPIGEAKATVKDATTEGKRLLTTEEGHGELIPAVAASLLVKRYAGKLGGGKSQRDVEADTDIEVEVDAANRAVTSSSGGAGLVYDIDFAAINATRARTVAGNGGVLSGPQNARQTIATVMDTGGDLFSSRNLGGLGPLHAEPTVLSQLPASSQPWIISTSNNFCGGHCYPMLQDMNAAFLRHSPRATGYKTAVFPRPPDPTR